MYLSGSILPRGKTCVPWSSYIPLWEPNTSAQKSLWPWIPPIPQEPPVEQRVVPLLSCFFSRGFPKDYDIPQHIGCYNPRTNHPPTGVDHCSVVESQTFTGQNLWNVCHLYQGSDQDSKMTHILRVYLLTYTLHKPYGRYLRFKYLKWPVIMYILYIYIYICDIFGDESNLSTSKVCNSLLNSWHQATYTCHVKLSAGNAIKWRPFILLGTQDMQSCPCLAPHSTQGELEEPLRRWPWHLFAQVFCSGLTWHSRRTLAQLYAGTAEGQWSGVTRINSSCGTTFDSPDSHTSQAFVSMHLGSRLAVASERSL